MKNVYRLCGVIGAAGLLLAACLLTVIAHAAPTAPTTGAIDAEDLPAVGFVADGDAVNPAGQSGEAPALAMRPNSSEPWVALVQNNQIIVSKFVSTTKTWVRQGNALHLNSASTPSSPSLMFGGPDHNTPWVTWSEGQNRIHAARLDGDQWTFTGSDGPTLNQPSDRFVYDPVLAVGDPLTEAVPLPWLAWGEGDGSTGQLEIRRAVSDATALGGIRWQPLSAPTFPDVASKLDLVFAGPNQRVPWLAWSTNNDTGGSQVFVTRALSDPSALGGFRWEKLNGQANCPQNAPSDCALNPAAHTAISIRVAAGALPSETELTPWVVFSQRNDLGAAELHVMRLDVGTPADPADDRFIPVGGVVNAQCLQRDNLTAYNGIMPDIYFVGNVPHVAWIEQQNDSFQLLVCHLADARPGQERWDFDTITPINRQRGTVALWPSLSSNGTTPYVAWQEGQNPGNVFVAHRAPDGAAWGRNYPPFIRTISWSREFVGQAFATAGIERALQTPMASTRILTLTTSCDHVNGWEHIKEIHFKVANAKLTAFSGKYVAASNQVFIETPQQPGSFLGGFQPGVGQPVETTNVTFYLEQMRIRPHGAGSAVLDIDWVMSFKEPLLFQDMKQMLNIVYDDGQSTGFFETGLLSFDYRMYLPAVRK